MDIQKLGKKIVVVGVSASGKSTFSRELADKMHIPLTLIDSIMWKPNWEYIGDEETVKKLGEISLRDEWIIEGYITKDARNFVFDRADTIIYLDYSPVVSSWRYMKRWWTHRKHSRPELPGSPDKFSFKFLRLVWTKGEAISLNRYLSGVGDQSKIIMLASPGEAQTFIIA